MSILSVNIDNALNNWAEGKDEMSYIHAQFNDWIKEKHNNLGWIDLPLDAPKIDKDFRFVNDLINHIDTLVVIGIGGSNMGIKALQNALLPPFPVTQNKIPEILYAGDNIDSDYLNSLLRYLEHRRFALLVISKSGTTLEPALAFRVLYNKLVEQVGQEIAKERIVVITGQHKSALLDIAKHLDLRIFSIPENVGGRFSLFSSVGVLPAILLGIDIEALFRGALDIREEILNKNDIQQNVALRYAYARYQLYKSGKKVELMATFEKRLVALLYWWQQLFAESEGKNDLALYPSPLFFTTDLHSVGQWIQQGDPIAFETFLHVDLSSGDDSELCVPHCFNNIDGLDSLLGMSFTDINDKAMKGVLKAHAERGIPIIEISIKQLDAYHIGALLFFFEMAVSYSALLLGVEPYNQPGVENYKNHMYKLLHK